MRFHSGGIDQHLRWRTASLGQCVEKIGPDAFRSPPDVAIVERLLRPVFGRRVDPAPARFQHMYDATDHTPIIDAGFAACVGGKMWRNPRKLRVRQPEVIPIHLRFLSEAVNHNTLIMPTVLWVRTLGSVDKVT